MSPRLNPLIAASHVVPATEASHEGAAAETAAHHADEEDETAMEGARQFQHHESADSSRVGGTSSGALLQSLVRGMRARARAQC